MLEAASNSNLVAVRYDGCHLEVLSRCTLDGEYEYHPTTHKRDEVRIQNEDALWTELPLGAARLEAALSREGQLNVDMTVVGRLEANVDSVEAPETAACSGATHLVTGITVGAFAMYTGDALEVRAGGSVGNVGAGASHGKSRGVLRQDGDFEACEAADIDADGAPLQCGALLRVELAAIGSDGALSGSTAPDRSAAEANQLDQDADRMRTIWKSTAAGAGVAGVGAVVALGLAVIQSSQIGDAEFDGDEETASEIQGERRIAVGVGIGLIGVTAALAATAGVLHGRENQMRARSKKLRDKTAIVPTFDRGFAGLSVAGRF